MRLTAHSSVTHYNYRLLGPLKSLLTIWLCSLAFAHTKSQESKTSFKSFHSFFSSIIRNWPTNKSVLTQRDSQCIQLVKPVIKSGYTPGWQVYRTRKSWKQRACELSKCKFRAICGDAVWEVTIFLCLIDQMKAMTAIYFDHFLVAVYEWVGHCGFIPDTSFPAARSGESVIKNHG